MTEATAAASNPLFTFEEHPDHPGWILWLFRDPTRFNAFLGEVLVRVTDDGPGIDPALADRLFEPFVRGEESRNRATGGTGLGLTIVRAILTRHGGRVTLANRVEGGAVATVALPLVRG